MNAKSKSKFESRYESPLSGSNDSPIGVAKRDRKSIYSSRVGIFSETSVKSSSSSNLQTSEIHAQFSTTSLNTVIQIKDIPESKTTWSIEFFIQEMINISYIDSFHVETKVMLGYLHLRDENLVSAAYHFEQAMECGATGKWNIILLQFYGECLKKLGREKSHLQILKATISAKRDTCGQDFCLF